jgi:hypothetical protein
MICVDGAWAESVPVSAARVLGAASWWASTSSRDIDPIDAREDIDNSLDILMRAGDLTRLFMNTLRTARRGTSSSTPRWRRRLVLLRPCRLLHRRRLQSARARVPALKKALLLHRIRAAIGLGQKRRG